MIFIRRFQTQNTHFCSFFSDKHISHATSAAIWSIFSALIPSRYLWQLHSCIEQVNIRVCWSNTPTGLFPVCYNAAHILIH
jgi:hypothetical protein